MIEFCIQEYSISHSIEYYFYYNRVGLLALHRRIVYPSLYFESTRAPFSINNDTIYVLLNKTAYVYRTSIIITYYFEIWMENVYHLLVIACYSFH
nr:ankyrin repeat protein [Oriental turtle dovepox virus]